MFRCITYRECTGFLWLETAEGKLHVFNQIKLTKLNTKGVQQPKTDRYPCLEQSTPKKNISHGEFVEKRDKYIKRFWFSFMVLFVIGYSPVFNAHVVATIERPDNPTSITLQLFDNGAGMSITPFSIYTSPSTTVQV